MMMNYNLSLISINKKEVKEIEKQQEEFSGHSIINKNLALHDRAKIRSQQSTKLRKQEMEGPSILRQV